MSQISDEASESYRRWLGMLDEDQPHHFIIEDDPANPVPVSLYEWGRWLEDNWKKKIVKQTRFPWGTFVSTVFLGLDHGWRDPDSKEPYKPVLWESMTFPWYGRAGEDRDMDRYTSYADAVAGHKRMVRRALKEDILTLFKGAWRILSKGTPKEQDAQAAKEMRVLMDRFKIEKLSK